MVHLCVHSWFSFLSGASSPEVLARRAAHFSQAALCLTDDWTLSGAVRHARACKAHGLRPLFGATVHVNGASLVLVAADRAGYANLCDILTQAHRTRLNPHLALADLDGRSDGLFALAAPSFALEDWPRLRTLFGDRLFLEVTHLCRQGDTARLRCALALADSLALRVVATNAVRHAAPADYDLHDALTCARHRLTIAQGHPERPVNDAAFLCSEREMLRRGLPACALANSDAIARECEVEMLPGQVTPPEVALPPGVTASAHLRGLCQEGFRRRFPGGNPAAVPVLEKELGVIAGLELDEFFLVVREVIEFARGAGIRCSGRGSAANSLVAYLLGITEVDPIRHKLLFERFLHAGRAGMPDIDVDFQTDRRGEVIEWMARKYGETHTAMTANLVTFRLRSAVREMAKTLGFPLSHINWATKLLPDVSALRVRAHRNELIASLGHGLDSPAIEVLCSLVERLHGCPRHLSLHSGGMLLTREPLRFLSPIQTSANSVRQVVFAKDDVESLGLIKFDLLGLRMLSVIAEALSLLRAAGLAVPDIDNLPLDDAKTFELIRAGETMSVFQIESPGQWNLLSRSQPVCFDDLVAQVAIFRPGPLQAHMVHPFVRRRRGWEKVVYPHPSLEAALRDTYGVILYQEQILEVAHLFAGLSLTQADEFRRLMSKQRDPGEMEAMRGLFVSGAIKTHGVSPAKANEVFDIVAKFVGYGFCKSHASAFARTVYQSAYLKAHFPLAYMAATLEHMPGFFPQQTVLEEARRLGVTVLPPCLHRSGVKYLLEDGAIRVPLTQIRKISPATATCILLERALGDFASLDDAVARLSLSREQWEHVARSGALRSFGKRRDMLWRVRILARDKPGSDEQLSLDFSVPDNLPELPPLRVSETTLWDFQTQGITTGPHPIARHRRDLERLGALSVADLAKARPGSRVLVGGLVISRQRPPTAAGMTFLILEDETSRLPTALIPPLYEKFMLALREPALLIEGKLEGGGLGAGNNYRSVLITRLWPLSVIAGGYSSHPGQMAR